jgi:hypothetical protein
VSYQHPRISVEQACQAYSLTFSELNYDNGLLSGWVSRDNQTYPMVHFINPATKTKVGAVDRWTFRLLVVNQILDINQSQGEINTEHDAMDFVSDAIQQELNRGEMSEVTSWVAREVQQFADHNVTGWLVDVTFEGAGQCIGGVVNKVATPRFIPQGGTFGGFAIFELACSTPDAVIYYTLDGSEVTPQTGLLYSGPVTLTGTAQPKAKAYKVGLTDSDTATAQFYIDLLTLSFSVAGGVFPIDSPPSIVPIVNNPDADVFYTLNGDTPTEGDVPFTTAFIPTQNTTLTGRAFASPADPSNVVQQVYQLKLNAPLVAVQSGVYESSVLVEAIPAAIGANEYSIDGGMFVVGDSVLVDVTSEVVFRATDPDYVTSDLVTREIEIQCAAPTIVPDGGVFEDEQEVTIVTNEPDGVTYYTTDGATPTQSDPTTVPFDLTATSTVKARTFRAGTTPSVVVEAVFTLAVRALVAVNASGEIYLSTDKGASWSNIADDPLVYLGVASQEGASPIVAFSTTGIRRTVDLGTNWTTPTAPTGHQSFITGDLDSNNGICFASRTEIPAERNVFLTANGFETLTPVTIGGKTASDNWTAGAIKGNTIVAVRSSVTTGDNLEVYISRDLGASWTIEYTEANRKCSSIYISDDEQTISIGKINLADSAGTASILLSNDNGQSFTEIEAGYKDVCGDGQDVIYIINPSATIRRSINRGASFTTVSSNSISGILLSTVCNVADDRLLASTTSRIYMSSNQGATLPEIQPAGNVSRSWRQVIAV